MFRKQASQPEMEISQEDLVPEKYMVALILDHFGIVEYIRKDAMIVLRMQLSHC